MSSREFDVIVWGASGFTGALVAEYLAEQYGVGGELRWALAGRNMPKLERVRSGLAAGKDVANLPTLIADSFDLSSLRQLAERTRVICSTVGPYALYGSKLVAACVSTGTHYCDLSGEVHWIRQMIDAHHTSAGHTGARIVHACGFDSIPSDMGVYWLQREMWQRHKLRCRAVNYRTESFRGSFSGGTVASMMHMMELAASDNSIMTIVNDPYSLNPDGSRGLDGPEKTHPEYDPDFASWVAPFVMAAINTKVVRRSNALSGFSYGREFRYDEGSLMPYGHLGFPLAAAVAMGTSAFTAATRVGWLRDLLANVLPVPGEGPDRERRNNGFFKIQLLGKHPSDVSKDLRLRIHGDRDPGYGSTARMLGESAVCLANDELTSAGGVLTPAVAMGQSLLQRLHTNAGVTFNEIDDG
jgi:short subunit dehydrogenase-like uncharacterized protein